MAKTSPFAPDRFPELPTVKGLRLGAAAAGIRYRDRLDLFLAEMAEGTTVAGVFTQSRTASPPVAWCRRCLPAGRARAIVANSGNANTFTGPEGRDAVARTAGAAAGLVGCGAEEVFVASTGVIGEPLPAPRILDALPPLHGRLRPDAWEEAARAIMTTDTFPKGAGATCRIGDTRVSIAGIAKGSGMIAPNMATMLAFVFTDARLPSGLLQKLLVRGCERSFNCITVDGDTSTSDTLLLCATGAAGPHAPVERPGDPALRDFRRTLDSILEDLARQIVRDGEGATKFVTITVAGAATRRAARRIAMSVANSPLVKTAIAGADANWGRIVMAVGKAEERIDPDRLSIRIGGVVVAENGARRPDYDEAPVAAHMAGREIDIDIDVGVGRGRATVWTCDLGHGYVDINADYRT